ncbi:hypothetical protein Tco_0381370 [Tanacetum coccineum]
MLHMTQSQLRNYMMKYLKNQGTWKLTQLKKLSFEEVKEEFDKLDEIETINIELEHRVTKLITENEHLKQTYKQLYDSIKPSRFRAKEQTESLVNQVNQKSVEISDLNAQLQEKVFVITALKNDLRKLKVKPSTSASGLKPSGNTKNDRISRTLSSYEKNKVEVQSRKVKSKLNKQNSDSKKCCNEHVKHPVKAIESTSKKNKKRKEWKPTGKVYNYVGYKWKPTERTFTLIGNACPLTRITATNKVPLRVPIPLEVVAPQHKMELGTSRGSDTSVAPSSSSLEMGWYL